MKFGVIKKTTPPIIKGLNLRGLAHEITWVKSQRGINYHN